jgi:hypothetical protein
VSEDLLAFQEGLCVPKHGEENLVHILINIKGIKWIF